MKETDWPNVSVSYNEETFTILYNKQGEENWKKSYTWKALTKVCFKSYDYGAPHFCYLYFKDNSDEIILPVEENDTCVAFWKELKKRGMFDPNKEIVAQYSSRPEFNCHVIK
ncbi:MAG: hypothetical protein JXA54_16715 [Candidatus Heimdallarchaeota archaeon]|nr:hypothetical protein [Candidatus Heimdallarchaeota archaeon]